ncbi:MAG: amidase [Actinomycetota bacterium]|nr:amidase [Actinomycetota bacterium]
MALSAHAANPIIHSQKRSQVPDELVFRTARELATAIRTRELSAREVMQAHLDQIEACNPAVNAIVSLDGDAAMAAADRADRADRQLTREAPLGVLHGLPMAHKDTHLTGGLRTTFGSPVHADFVPKADELIVERLHAAGVLTTGKTNVPEFAAGSHTFNPVFGATGNAYDPTRSAGGSSGGAAVALACGFQPLSDGSDMGGSLRNPAAWNNVVGLRPSPGRVPSYPSVVGWATMGVQGPMARTVDDVALMLSVIAGPDRRSPIALETPGSTFDADLALDPNGLRLAWSPDLGGEFAVEPEIVEILTGAVGVFESAGAIIDPASPNMAGAEQVFRTLRAWQFQLTHANLMRQHGDQVKASFADNIAQGQALSGPDVGRAEVLHTALFHRVREFFERYDALLLPVTQLSPFPIEQEFPTLIAGVEQADYLDWMRSAYLISATGSPALSVPAGFTADGMPVGLQIVGPHRADWLVLQLGHAFEQATGYGRRRPSLVRAMHCSGRDGAGNRRTLADNRGQASAAPETLGG